MKRLIGAFVAVAVLLVLLIDPANAITITDATLSSGTVTVSGNKAAKAAAITWEGTQVATSTSGGAFTFTTAVVPADCVGTLSDGVSTIDVAISGCPPPTELPATGQTTSYTAGDDGDIKAGATLSYTDNGDGTITDNNTGLMWEKKVAGSGCLHCVDDTYSWCQATGSASGICVGNMTSWIADVNAENFAGYSDWRLPNVKELESILNFENFNPAVSSAFNTECADPCTVLTCSCTGFQYWSSSTFPVNPVIAWLVVFSHGGTGFGVKSGGGVSVRAVRGGL